MYGNFLKHLSSGLLDTQFLELRLCLICFAFVYIIAAVGLCIFFRFFFSDYREQVPEPSASSVGPSDRVPVGSFRFSYCCR